MSRCARVLAVLTCLLLVGGLGVAATSPPAAATSTRLCTGYAGCRSLGMPDAGYQAAAGRMFWLMYAGHNCTNYVAYRMVRSGLPNIRPWTGGGNATYWGGFNPSLTDSIPRVGAVAWWKANVPGAGRAGHVAYVERVVSADEIIVSEDNWGGDFHWRRITRAGTGWPSGFIHFNDVPLRNTVRPVVSGTTRVGAVLTASPGTWKPGATTYAYRWRADGVPIADATGRRLRLRRALRGKRISVRVTASRLGYPTTVATSVPTAAVESGVLANAAPPAVTGEATVDATLTASPGEWTAAPTTLAYQWLADGAPLDGATGATFSPGAGLVGATLSVTVTAQKAGYADASATSAPTGPVTKAAFALADRPAVTGTPTPGETLTLEPGTFAPADAAMSVRWLRDGAPIGGATGPAYRLTTADLGSRVAARLRLRKPGYTPLRTRTPAPRRVRSAAVLQVRTAPGVGRLAVTVDVTARGVRPVTGTVRIRSRGALLDELTLRRGAAATTLTGLAEGRRTLRIRYLGSDTVTAVAVARAARVG